MGLVLGQVSFTQAPFGGDVLKDHTKSIMFLEQPT